MPRDLVRLVRGAASAAAANKHTNSTGTSRRLAFLSVRVTTTDGRIKPVDFSGNGYHNAIAGLGKQGRRRVASPISLDISDNYALLPSCGFLTFLSMAVTSSGSIGLSRSWSSGPGPAGATAARSLARAGVACPAARSGAVSTQQALRRRHQRARAAAVSLSVPGAVAHRDARNLTAVSGRARAASRP